MMGYIYLVIYLRFPSHFLKISFTCSRKRLTGTFTCLPWVSNTPLSVSGFLRNPDRPGPIFRTSAPIWVRSTPQNLLVLTVYRQNYSNTALGFWYLL